MGVHVGDDTVLVTSVDLPDDGDPPDAASVNVPLEAAIDGVAYLASRVLTWTPAGSTGLGQKVNLFSPGCNRDSRFTAEYDVGTGVPIGQLQTGVGSVGAVGYQVTPPHAMARLAAVLVRLKGGHGAGHGATKPATMPAVVISTVADGAVTIVSTTGDLSASAAIYDAPHTIVCPGPDNDPLSVGEQVTITFEGETGANSVASTTLLLDIICQWTSEDIP